MSQAPGEIRAETLFDSRPDAPVARTGGPCSNEGSCFLLALQTKTFAACHMPYMQQIC